MGFIRHVMHRARGIGSTQGKLAMVSYLSHPRERWRNWKRYA